jgi:hypothetical protein
MDNPYFTALIRLGGGDWLFEVGDEYALPPREQSRHDKTDPLPTPCRSITKDVLRADVPQVVYFASFVSHQFRDLSLRSAR